MDHGLRYLGDKYREMDRNIESDNEKNREPYPGGKAC